MIVVFPSYIFIYEYTFLVKNYITGGIALITVNVANAFQRDGHSVTFVCFNPPEKNVLELLDERIRFYTLGRFSCSSHNVRKLRSILIEHCIEVAVNHWGLPFIPLLTLRKAARGLNIKIASSYYNNPEKNNRIVPLNNKLKQTKGIARLPIMLKHYAARIITGLSMHYNYVFSDRYVLMSDSFTPLMKKFAYISDTSKIVGIPSPLTRHYSDYTYNFNEKNKEVIYVGRLENTQKRVDLSLDVWVLCQRKFPDWKFTIVGDGPDRKKLEEKVANENIVGVTFEGKQDPTPYYKRSSVLLLTSEYEGFAAVLTECMSFGVVPVAYGSYISVYDIITTGKDGFILPYNKTGLDVAAMAQVLIKTISDKEKLEKMARTAMESCKKFSIDKVYPMWRDMIVNLK